jgi:membrane-associated protease RseP (regulator of RpoE activity)
MTFRFLLTGMVAMVVVSRAWAEPAPAEAPPRVEGYLGVTTSALPAEFAEQAGLPHGVGLRVMTVSEGSPAAKAGLMVGDALHKLDDQLLVNDAQLRTLVRIKAPGDEVTLTLIRNGEVKAVPVTIGRMLVVERRNIIGLGGEVREMREARRLAIGNARFKDDEHDLVLTTIEGRKTLVAKDAAGVEVFNGPVDTPEQRAALPAAVRLKLERLEALPRMPMQQRMQEDQVPPELRPM